MECINVNDNRRLCVEVTRLDDADKVFVENIVDETLLKERSRFIPITDGAFRLTSPSTVPASAVKILEYEATLNAEGDDYLNHPNICEMTPRGRILCYLECMQGPTVNGMDLVTFIPCPLSCDDVPNPHYVAAKCEYDNAWHDCKLTVNLVTNVPDESDTLTIKIVLGEGASFNGVDITSILGNGFKGVWIDRPKKNA